MKVLKFSSDLADKIATLSINHYLALPGKSGKPCKPGEWTLMSAVVLETENGSLKVIALGTGSKCLGKNELSRDGGLVADSHAEVIARRATILYIYGQLKQLLDRKKSELFDRLENGKAWVRPGTKFHLFTSHTPCGDASIIPKTEGSYFYFCCFFFIIARLNFK
jgi:tRNA-specific adenosine deaminase 1